MRVVKYSVGRKAKNLRKTKVSIIVVYYGGFKSLVTLLRSIGENTSKISSEIIVVNNKIKDDVENLLKSEFEEVVYVESPGNIGYGRGNNLGAKYAKGEYLFIINPDTKVVRNCLKVLVKFLDKNKKAAIVAPNLVDNKERLFKNIGTSTLTPIKGIFALSFINKLFPGNPFSRDYYLKDVLKNRIREVNTVPGSAFLIRKKVFEEVCGFDENFFLYFEEFDLCKRINDLGHKIFIVPNAEVVHEWKSGDGGEKLKKVFEKSRFYYFKKHFGYLDALIVESFARTSKLNLGVGLVLLLVAFLVAYFL